MNPHPSAIASPFLPITGNPQFTAQIEAAKAAAMADFHKTRMREIYQKTMREVGFDISPFPFFRN